jgi:peptidoglycan/xylan/chitin deacetylase (PgdA/CDA1 family)
VGSVVISIDAELGWGFIDHESPPTRRVEHARSGWELLCDRLDTYDIPATWAIVGHLFHDRCDGDHSDHPAWPEWFEREGGPWADRPDLTCGADLVERVQQSAVDHDIGGHTYAHIEFGAPGTDREIASYELARSVDLATEWGIDLDSFVFPRNNLGHRDVLAEHGFRTYRALRPGPRRGVPGRLLDSLRDESPPLVRPAVDEYGLVNLPASLFLHGFDGLPLRATQLFGHDPIVTLAKRGIEAAANEDGVFHCWLHPNNLVGPSQRRRLDAILETIHRHRDELRIETMADVADRVRTSTVEASDD